MRKVFVILSVLALVGLAGFAQTKTVNVMHGWPGNKHLLSRKSWLHLRQRILTSTLLWKS